jgi:hypothetical protein
VPQPPLATIGSMAWNEWLRQEAMESRRHRQISQQLFPGAG